MESGEKGFQVPLGESSYLEKSNLKKRTEEKNPV